MLCAGHNNQKRVFKEPNILKGEIPRELAITRPCNIYCDGHKKVLQEEKGRAPKRCPRRRLRGQCPGRIPASPYVVRPSKLSGRDFQRGMGRVKEGQTTLRHPESSNHGKLLAS